MHMILNNWLLYWATGVGWCGAGPGITTELTSEKWRLSTSRGSWPWWPCHPDTLPLHQPAASTEVSGELFHLATNILHRSASTIKLDASSTQNSYSFINKKNQVLKTFSFPYTLLPPSPLLLLLYLLSNCKQKSSRAITNIDIMSSKIKYVQRMFCIFTLHSYWLFISNHNYLYY